MMEHGAVMPNVGITLTMPADAKALKRWQRLFKRYPKTFDLPDPIGGKWIVRGFETRGSTPGLAMMTVYLAPIFEVTKPKGKRK